MPLSNFFSTFLHVHLHVRDHCDCFIASLAPFINIQICLLMLVVLSLLENCFITAYKIENQHNSWLIKHMGLLC